jgi:hypothetical protein
VLVSVVAGRIFFSRTVTYLRIVWCCVARGEERQMEERHKERLVRLCLTLNEEEDWEE